MVLWASLLALTAGVATPVGGVPLPETAGGSRVASADLDGDGQEDHAGLFLVAGEGKVVLTFRSGDGPARILETFADTPRSRSLTLSIREGGDHTCRRRTEDPRQCGRGWYSRRRPSLVVTAPDGRSHLWLEPSVVHAGRGVLIGGRAGSGACLGA